MNTVNDKISVKNFNDFFENDQTSRAFSRLAERKLKKFEKVAPKFYKYNRDELLALSQHPTSKMTKTEFHARLKNPELDEEIILSFQKKDRHNNDLIDFLMDNNRSTGGSTSNRSSYNNNNNHSSGMSNTNNNISSNNNENAIKTYHRYSKYNNHSSGGQQQQSWRTADRFSPNFRKMIRDGGGSGNHRTGGGRRNDGSSSHHHHHRNHRYDNGRMNDNYNSKNEPEPEWFSDGPKSMTDFIDLKGFDDDDDDDYNGDDGDLIEEENDEELMIKSLDEKTHKGESSSSSFLFSDISKDDFSSLLDSSDISILDNDLSQIFGMNSSRSARWFKSKMANNSRDGNDDDRNNERKLSSTSSSSTIAMNDSNISLMDLFQMKNIDIIQLQQTLPQMPTNQIQLSKAVNVSELEASLLNSNNTTGSSSSSSSSSSIQTPKPMKNELSAEDLAIMSKLKFLATPQSPPTTTTMPSQTPTNLPIMIDDENNKSLSSSFDSTSLHAMFDKSFRHNSPTIVAENQSSATNNQLNHEISELDILKRRSLQPQPQQQPPPPPMHHPSLDGFPFVMPPPLNHSTGVRPLFSVGHPALHPASATMPLNQLNPMAPMNRMQFPTHPQTPFMMGGFPRMMIHPSLRAPGAGVAVEKHFMNLDHHGQPQHSNPAASNLFRIIPTPHGHTTNIRNPPMNLHAMMLNNESRPDVNQCEDNNSMTHKMLKNSKFTPTSVFRKLKDHENQANKAKTNLQQKISTTEPGIGGSIQSQQQQQKSSHSINNSDNNTPKNLSEMTNLLMQQLNITNNSSIKQQSSEMPSSKSSSSSGTIVNPNDIFNVFKVSNPVNNNHHHHHPMTNDNHLMNIGNNNTNNPNGNRIELPPLPLQNALTLEDLEKL
ncbi:hypothetical protein DERF_012837 [Dermatophagoides farinae]|uniref:Uncharacterized protein n=1 Tax=Dermatophagoides farinae TaxID=6954 RepID=A0A922L3U1_DERFA|nr:hypothetical protein DERF_012837 [Dermatophagoides farinae]